METLQNTPFGFKVWSKGNTPISVSPESFDNSQHERDAMLQVIGFLITENKSLKLENIKLKEGRRNYDSQVKLQEADKQLKLKEAVTQLKLKEAQQESQHRKRMDTIQFSKPNRSIKEVSIGKVCNSCNLRHVNTKDCPALCKKCHHCKKLNHFSTVC